MSWPSGYPKNMTAEQRIERGKNAARARASTDGLIKALTKKPDPLTAEQCQRLVDVIRESQATRATEGGSR